MFYLSNQQTNGFTDVTMLATSANVCVETTKESIWLRFNSLCKLCARQDNLSARICSVSLSSS